MSDLIQHPFSFVIYLRMRFQWKYGLIAFLIFLIEVVIAVYVRDSFIRPVFGDLLVVVLLYFGVRTFFKGSPQKVAIGVLLFAVTIEVLQYFKLAELLGLEKNSIAQVVLGTTFSLLDLLAYLIGTIIAVLLDVRFLQSKFRS